MHALRVIGFAFLTVSALMFFYGLWLDLRTKLPDIEEHLSFDRIFTLKGEAFVEFDRQHLIWLRATLRQVKWWMASNALMIPAVLCLGIAVPQWYLKVVWLLIAAVRIASLPQDRKRLDYWRGRVTEVEDRIVAQLRVDEEAERILREDT